MHVPQTRVQPVGRYTPGGYAPRTAATGGNVPPSAAQGYFQPPVQVTVSPAVKSFFSDVWVGARDQLKSHGQKVLNPIDTINRGLDTTPRQFVRRTLAPYRQAFRAGRPGQALGRLLANVAVVGGVVLGGRALLSRGLPNIGGGASVGYRGPIGMAFDSVTRFVGGIANGAGNLVRGVGNAVGGAVRWLIGGGGGAGVGLG